MFELFVVEGMCARFVFLLVHIDSELVYVVFVVGVFGYFFKEMDCETIWEVIVAVVVGEYFFFVDV